MNKILFFVNLIISITIFPQQFNFFYDVDTDLLPVADNNYTYDQILYEYNGEEIFQNIITRDYNEKLDFNFKIQKILFVEDTNLAIITFNNTKYRASYSFYQDVNIYSFKVYSGGSFVMYIYNNNNIFYSLRSYDDFKKGNSRIMIDDDITVVFKDKQVNLNAIENNFNVNYYGRIEIMSP